MINIKIEKLVFGGQGMGHLDDGRVCFVWNALPGEEVEIELTRNKKDFCEGIAKKILVPSPHRIEPRDTHFLSCSPWQILDPTEEDKWKVEMGKETYKKLADLDWDLEIVNDEKIFGYRNKMEFSFSELEDGQISLGFFNRGGKNRYAIPKCELADPLINETALNVLAWINKNKITLRSLKAMIVRSNSQGQVIVALFIKDKMKFTNYPELNNSFVGFQLYYSTHKSPASVPTALLYSVAQDYLITELNGVKLKFGLLSFFQIHLPVFQMALA
ncbi:MAG: TRAM domain-containing protein, partial [Candidatus Magasanikiibacteriota bacterium]